MTMRTSQGLLRVQVPLSGNQRQQFYDGYDRIFGKKTECKHEFVAIPTADAAKCWLCGLQLQGSDLVNKP